MEGKEHRRQSVPRLASVLGIEVVIYAAVANVVLLGVCFQDILVIRLNSLIMRITRQRNIRPKHISIHLIILVVI